MGTFSYSANPKKLSMGNRVAYVYELTDVQTSGSILYTPFKKITTYLIETIDPATSTITVSSNTEATGGTGNGAYLTFTADAESDGRIIVVGLL